MTERCLYYESCGFIQSFITNDLGMRKGWIYSFCHDEEKAVTCSRRIAQEMKGEFPADNVSPIGTKL